METMNEIIPFAKEIMSQRPSRGMMKVYLLGSTLALFGVVGGLVETVCMPFCDQEPLDEEMIKLITEEKKRQMLEPEIITDEPDVVDELQTEIDAKKPLESRQRRASIRSHAC
ncbi:G0/G1 switch protein 2-like [Oncorhynchus clarkii lewisi]|uniref:G0/G1 switch protein 2-like n=1 Tax=Oncorhynchus clarkii lewisi TaxID=490388 RepID=UPI0039B9674F